MLQIALAFPPLLIMHYQACSSKYRSLPCLPLYCYGGTSLTCVKAMHRTLHPSQVSVYGFSCECMTGNGQSMSASWDPGK